MTFKQYIRQFANEENLHGDVARYIERYCDFPDTSNATKIIRYMSKRQACDEALEDTWSALHDFIFEGIPNSH